MPKKWLGQTEKPWFSGFSVWAYSKDYLLSFIHGGSRIFPVAMLLG
jgi:hypothetical protein